MRRRFGSLASELGKFVGVGVAAYVIDTTVFNVAFYAWNLNAFNAKVIATLIAVSIAFIGNRYWTWRNHTGSTVTNEYVRYFVFNAIGLGINLVWVWVYQEALSIWPSWIDNPVALNFLVNIVGVGTASLFRFYAYRTWVFRAAARPPDRDDA